jgi:hypothetical protein
LSWIFTACEAYKNQFQNFKIDFCRLKIQFVKLDFSKLPDFFIPEYTGCLLLSAPATKPNFWQARTPQRMSYH